MIYNILRVIYYTYPKKTTYQTLNNPGRPVCFFFWLLLVVVCW